jgi:hypothetical protein
VAEVVEVEVGLGVVEEEDRRGGDGGGGLGRRTIVYIYIAEMRRGVGKRGYQKARLVV